MENTLPASFFELIKNSDKPILVDFYADWCGPCKMVSPAIAQVAKAKKGEIITIKINVDKKPAIAGHYQVAGIPTIMLFKDGKSILRLQGARPFDQILAEVNKALAG